VPKPLEITCAPLQDGGLLIGAAVTQEEVIDRLLELAAPATAAAKLTAAAPQVAGSFMSRLWGGASSGAAAASADPKHVWLPIAKHLQRIAGNQVHGFLIDMLQRSRGVKGVWRGKHGTAHSISSDCDSRGALLAGQGGLVNSMCNATRQCRLLTSHTLIKGATRGLRK